MILGFENNNSPQKTSSPIIYMHELSIGRFQSIDLQKKKSFLPSIHPGNELNQAQSGIAALSMMASVVFGSLLHQI